MLISLSIANRNILEKIRVFFLIIKRYGTVNIANEWDSKSGTHIWMNQFFLFVYSINRYLSNTYYITGTFETWRT